MDWARFIVEWLHVLAGIFWFGAVLYLDFIVIPAFVTLDPSVSRPASKALAGRATRIVPVVAGAVIILGFLRGTVFGPITSVDALTTSYGITWMISLVLAILTYRWAEFMVARFSTRLFNDDAYWQLDARGRPPAATTALVGQLRRNGMVELLLFLSILAAMVLMSMGQ